MIKKRRPKLSVAPRHWVVKSVLGAGLYKVAPWCPVTLSAGISIQVRLESMRWTGDVFLGRLEYLPSGTKLKGRDPYLYNSNGKRSDRALPGYGI